LGGTKGKPKTKNTRSVGITLSSDCDNRAILFENGLTDLHIVRFTKREYEREEILRLNTYLKQPIQHCTSQEVQLFGIPSPEVARKYTPNSPFSLELNGDTYLLCGNKHIQKLG
jgi:hypothetical protein